VTGAPSLSTPRGLGIADAHPGFIGVSGNGGSETLAEDLALQRPRFMLVLGTGLGEASSGWDERLVPPGGLVHVDIDPRVPGRAFPGVPTLAVQSGIGEFLDAVLAHVVVLVRHALVPMPERAQVGLEPAAVGTVHPVELMRAIQREIVDATAMPVLADASASFFWAARHVRFRTPSRWAIEGRFGSMGFAGAAVVGAASASNGPALAICGDGSMHMQDELATAVRYGIHAIWVVMNDSGLGIVRHGMKLRGRKLHDADYPPANFAEVAAAKGAEAARVTSAQELDQALREAVAHGGPFLIDVVIDRDVVPPILARTHR
jgi:acetolactate synthase-1/2/3 large subunit